MLLGLLLFKRSQDSFTTVHVSLHGKLSWGSINSACVLESPGSPQVINFPRQNERQNSVIDFMVLRFLKTLLAKCSVYVWYITHGRDVDCGVHADYIRKIRQSSEWFV